MKLTTRKAIPDKRGRVSLKGLVSENKTYEAALQPDEAIILTPFVQIEVHPKEAWFYKDTNAIKNVQLGLQQASDGKVVYRKSYAQYSNIDV